MTTFILTSPAGQKFKVTGPDGSTAEQAMQVFMETQQAETAGDQPQPGTREYADWARDQAMAGNELPQVSDAPPEWRQPAPQGMRESDLMPQVASGLNEGLTSIAGFPVDIMSSGINLATGLANNTLGTQIPQVTSPIGGSESMRGFLGNTFIKPETSDPLTQGARRIAEEFGASFIPAGAGVRAGQLAGHAAPEIARFLIGEGLLTAGSGAGAAIGEQVDPNGPAGELVGTVAGGLSAAGLLGLGKRLITPFGGSPISAERQASIDTLQNEGVNLTAGQQVGNNKLRYMESELGGGTAQNFAERQGEDFTAAALRRIGANGRRATPEVMNERYTRFNQEYGDIAARNELIGDQQLTDDLNQTWRYYASVTAPSDRIPAVQDFITEIDEAIQSNGGIMDGRTYQRLRSRLGELARGNKNPDRQQALYAIQHALDDAISRNMTADDVDEFARINREYRNFITLEEAATGAGEAAASGIISPAKLRQAVVSKQGKRNYTQGDGDFADLARSGVATMTPMPQSGTAPRLAAQTLGGVPTVVGGLLGNGALPGVGAVAGAVAGAAVPGLVGKALLSGPGRAYLTNRLLTGRTAGRGVSPVAAALANQEERRPIEIMVRGGAR